MTKPEVYDFEEFHELFRASVDWYKANDRRVSLRWLAQRLELKSHTFLMRIASGSKAPTDELLAKIAGVFDWSIDEFVYAKVLVGLKRATTIEEKEFFTQKRLDIRKESANVMLQLDAFELISHWYSLAIFELVHLKEFNSDPAWIAGKLGRSVTEEMVIETIERLVRLGLLKRLDNGLLQRAIDSFTTPHNIPSVALRRFHSQLLDLAKDSLESVPYQKRFLFGHTLPFHSEKLADAQHLIVEFRERFHNLMKDDQRPDSVYQLGIQFFPLTES